MTCQVQYILYTTFSKDSSLDRNLEKTWAVYLSASNDLLHSHQWCKMTDWAKVDPFDHKRRTRKIYELWNLCSINGRLWVDLCFRHQHKTQAKCKFTVSRYTNITHHNVALVSIRTVQLVVWFQVPPPLPLVHAMLPKQRVQAYCWGKHIGLRFSFTSRTAVTLMSRLKTRWTPSTKNDEANLSSIICWTALPSRFAQL